MEAVPPRNFPRERGTPVQTLPFAAASENAQSFYPPVCLKTHWDPTMILRHSMPTTAVALPMDPRPWTRICMEYVTAGDNEAAPPISSAVVLPSGGQYYPPNRYLDAIDNESQLRRLDRQLGIAEKYQYIPSQHGDMFNARSLVPERAQPSSQLISELAMPQALLRAGPYPCREEADGINMERSKKLFNNATKQDKYKQTFPTKKLSVQKYRDAQPFQPTAKVGQLYRTALPMA